MDIQKRKRAWANANIRQDVWDQLIVLAAQRRQAAGDLASDIILGFLEREKNRNGGKAVSNRRKG